MSISCSGSNPTPTGAGLKAGTTTDTASNGAGLKAGTTTDTASNGTGLKAGTTTDTASNGTGLKAGSTTDTTSGVVPTFRSADSDRKYLLERVDEAAVVQLYADGFEALPVDQRILIWHRDVKITYPQDLTKQMLEYADATRATREQFRASRLSARPEPVEAHAAHKGR